MRTVGKILFFYSDFLYGFSCEHLRLIVNAISEFLLEIRKLCQRKKVLM